MLNYNNTHIFTGYLKQLLSTVNIPTCKIYTREFAKYYEMTGQEDPRVIESIDTLGETRRAVRVNYLKDNDIATFKWQNPTELITKEPTWLISSSKTLFSGDNNTPGLTRTLKSQTNIYDYKTHNYLGDFLRFLRDYHDVNLMSLYNCFDNKIYNNIYFKLPEEKEAVRIEGTDKFTSKVVFPGFEMNSSDPNYRIYAVPVKLFENYTIAIDSAQEIEFFCGFYGTRLDASVKAKDLFKKTYKKFKKTNFNRPFLYDCLDVKYWNRELERQNINTNPDKYTPAFMSMSKISRWDIINKEQDLKLFIKVPASCTSSIVILEGNYLNYNDFKYAPTRVFRGSYADTLWEYKQNTYKLNFEEAGKTSSEGILLEDPANLNNRPFKPISKLQLLTLNTGESYPFANRLVEYLAGSAITPAEEIIDNIKRTQKIMSKNGYFFNLNGLWEPKIQKIAYDYVMNNGPYEVTTSNGTPAIKDKQRGVHPTIGHSRKSAIMDILGYIDKDVEKWYATWKLEPLIKQNEIIEGVYISSAVDTLQDTDIYNGLYDI